MASKLWTATTDTSKKDSPCFRTKREAIEYGRRTFSGIFFVLKKEPNKPLFGLKDATA
jgi:hypothetical protein